MKAWTTDQERLLREKYPVSTLRELTVLFPGKTVEMIKWKAKRMKLEKVKRIFRFTREQLDELKRDYPSTLGSELAERYGCPLSVIYNAAQRFGMKKDVEFIRETARLRFAEDHPARKFWIKKGTVSRNKGKKQTEFMSPEAFERVKRHRFQKGHLPVNTLYDYAITERRDSCTGRIYKYIRTGLAKWVPYQRYLWEQKYGEIPKGYNIQFKDGNSLNCTIDNLYMISQRDQLVNENSSRVRYPDEVRQLIQLKGVLTRQINKIEKDGSNKKTEGNG
jgi:hypothetical protein